MKLDVGRAIKFIRQTKGMSQGDIAKQNGWERSYVSDLERGVIKNPSLQTVLLLIKSLGITCNEFIGVAYGFRLDSHQRDYEAMAFISNPEKKDVAKIEEHILGMLPN
jgi:transcriptional regulator with XRE-family HTH domain